MTSYSFLMDLMRQQANMMPISWKIRPTNSLLKPYSVKDIHICQLPLFFREAKSLKFFIKFPGLLVRAPNLPGNTYRGLFQIFFINFVIFEMSKRKIKQEVYLVLLFELLSIGKHKTERSNWYIFNKYCNWSEKNQSNCTIHDRKLVQFLHTVIDAGDIGKAF